MNIDKKTARILDTITQEQWRAILKVAQQNLKVAPVSLSALEYKVLNTVKEMGVPPHFLGYKYLQEAIIMGCQDESYIHKVTVIIYPTIAKKYNVTVASVERAIRHAIQTVFNSEDPEVCEVLEKIFGDKYSFQN